MNIFIMASWNLLIQQVESGLDSLVGGGGAVVGGRGRTPLSVIQTAE